MARSPEHPEPELAEDEQPRPKLGDGQKGKKDDGENSDEPSLAELLPGFLAKPEGSDPNAPPPRIRSREDYYAAVEQKHPPSAASPGETAAAG